jgi:hypothetical protein
VVDAHVGPRKARGARRGEHAREVRALAAVDYVHQPVVAGAHAVAQRGEVRRRVGEPAVAFAHDERRRGAARRRVGQHCAVHVLRGAGAQQRVDDAAAHVAVEALAALLQRHAQAAVHTVKVRARHAAQPPPHGHGLGRAGLNGHHLGARAPLELGLAVEAPLGGLVQCVDGGNVDAIARPAKRVAHLRDEHAELRAPVADVVDAAHGVAAVLERARQRLADDGRPQVAHVHLLGDVG